MNAYDYHRQKWVSGPEAATILRRQYEEEIRIITGPRGSDYAKFLGLTPERVPQILAACRAGLAKLESGVAK